MREVGSRRRGGSVGDAMGSRAHATGRKPVNR